MVTTEYWIVNGSDFHLLNLKEIDMLLQPFFIFLQGCKLMQKTLYRACFLLLWLCFSRNVFAEGHWFLGAGVGAAFLNVDSNQFISSGPDWPNDKMHNTDVDAAGLFVLNGGYQWARQALWLPFYSVALNYTYQFPARVNGQVEQYSLPEFTNYDYQYKIKTQTLLAQFKVDLYQWQHLLPFLLAGAGVSFNNAGNYTEQALPNVTPRVSPGFSNRSTTCFSYALGVGFDYILQKNIWASLMYQYNNLGRVQTGTGANTDTLTDTNYSSDSLKTNIRSNTVLLSVTYLFDAMT